MVPLTDNTEARYAEIARKMAETGQWLVPQIDYGVPFWAKPPLSTWLSAASFKVLGVSEFAARLPSFLLGLAVCFLAYVLAARQRDDIHGLRAALVLATSALMLVSAGVVMTDPVMVAGTTLSMVAFWRARVIGSRSWGYAFFVGLAVGLLAKGPVAAVLTLLPIGAWALLAKRVGEMWRKVPWISGGLLTVVLVVPWYWAAELRFPGFLHYFIVGEHWQRFTVPGWQGDLYGSGHADPRGTIWLFALIGTLPWSIWALWRLPRVRPHIVSAALRADDGWLLYLLAWFLAPVLFFTMARNILPTYVLPGMVGFCVLVAERWRLREMAHAGWSRVAWLGLLMPVLTVAVVAVVWPQLGYESQRQIVATYERLDAAQHRYPLSYIGRRPYSAEFYTRGGAVTLETDTDLRESLSRPGPSYYVAKPSEFAGLPSALRMQLHPLVAPRASDHILLRHDSPP